MTRRWVIERKAVNRDRETLQVIEVYSEADNKDVVKQENRKWTHKRYLIRY